MASLDPVRYANSLRAEWLPKIRGWNAAGPPGQALDDEVCLAALDAVGARLPSCTSSGEQRARASEIGREVFDGILEAGVGIGFDEMRDEFLAKDVGVIRRFLWHRRDLWQKT